jgi:hypothetical protein
MKIGINYKKEKLNLSFIKGTSVRQLLKYLKKELKLEENDHLHLCSNVRLYDPNEELKKKNQSEEFVLLVRQVDKPIIKDIGDPIQKLIMKATDAEVAMKPARQGQCPFMHTNDIFDGFSIVRRLIRRPNDIGGGYNDMGGGDNNEDEDDEGENDDNNEGQSDFANIFMPIRQQPPELNLTHVQTLVDMGFPEPRVRTALRIARGNVDRATDLLLNSDEALDNAEEELGQNALDNRRRLFTGPSIFNFLSRRRNPESGIEGKLICIIYLDIFAGSLPRRNPNIRGFENIDSDPFVLE